MAWEILPTWYIFRLLCSYCLLYRWQRVGLNIWILYSWWCHLILTKYLIVCFHNIHYFWRRILSTFILWIYIIFMFSFFSNFLIWVVYWALAFSWLCLILHLLKDLFIFWSWRSNQIPKISNFLFFSYILLFWYMLF